MTQKGYAILLFVPSRNINNDYNDDQQSQWENGNFDPGTGRSETRLLLDTCQFRGGDWRTWIVCTLHCAMGLKTA